MGELGKAGDRNIPAASASTGLVRDAGGPALIDNDPSAIHASLQRELDRVRLTHDTSCICIVSPDGENARKAMDGFGRRFASKLRSYDAIFRFAEDKYLVMLPHIGREDAVSVIRRLREQVLMEPFAIADGASVTVTASFGGTMLDSKAPLNEHLDRAAEAYDWALKGRGDSICIWTPQL